MHQTIDDRLLLILKEAGGRSDGSSVFQREKGKHLAYKGFWLRMEELTDVGAGRWRNYSAGQQKAGTDMIGAVARLWPHYAFWLTTGITDATNGHTAPITAVTFPERLYADDRLATDYFTRSLNLLDAILENTPDRTTLERNKIDGDWWGGYAVEAAYEICELEEYRQLQETWTAREGGRNKRLGRVGKGREPRLEHTNDNPVVDSCGERGGDPRTRHQGKYDLFYTPGL